MNETQQQRDELTPLQQVMLESLLQMRPQGSRVLVGGEGWVLVRQTLEEGGAEVTSRASCQEGDLPAGEAFGAVVCLETFIQIAPRDWHAALVRLWNALLPGGCLYLTLPEESRSALSGEAVLEHLAQAGFRQVNAASRDGTRHFLALKRRLPTNQLDFGIDTRHGSQGA
jgi:hypothetical protein